MTKPISGRYIPEQTTYQSKAIIIVIAVTISIVSILIIYYNIRRINHSLYTRLQNGLTLGETILPQALWQLNYDYLDDFIKGICIDPIVVYVRITADNKTLAEYYRDGIQRMSFQEFQQSSGFISKSADINFKGNHIGCIEMVVSNKGIYQELILNAGVSFCIMIFLVIAISKYYKKLTETQQQYLELYENTIEGIYQTTPEGKIIRANPAMARILGYQSPKDLMINVNNLSTQVYVHPERRAELVRIINKKGMISDFETPFYRKDGSVIWVSISARAVKDASGKTIYFEGWLVDISERIEKEKAERDRRTAEVLAKAKSEFLANMSHEIRTPLNAIIGLSNLVLKKDLNQKHRDYIEKIWSSAKILTSIIDNILDFSKIETGKIKIESLPFQLDDILNPLADMFAKPVVEKNNELFIDVDDTIPQTLIGDPLRLSQILINLVSNAVKFTINGEILIKISRQDAKLDTRIDPNNYVQIRFSVSDTGIGIHPDNLSKLFTPFTQIDSSMTRKYGGTGLGLVICKRLIELMGGDIHVDSQPENGTEFVFLVSFGIQTNKPAARKQIISIPLQGMRIFIADNHPVSSHIASRILRASSLIPELIRSSRDLIHHLHHSQNKAHLILMDERMLKENPHIISFIRNDPNYHLTPLIVMAGFQKEELYMQKNDHTNAIWFITKPITRTSLLKTIASVYKKSLTESENSPYQQPVCEQQFAGKSILLVEDNMINQQVAAEILENEGFRVSIAANGEEAVEYIRQSYFDAVLMDVQMPVMDGIEATKLIRKITQERKRVTEEKLRSRDDSKKLPIIAMTAHALNEDKERCFAAGMDDYITKPIDPNHLIKILQKWIPSGTTSKKIPVCPPSTARYDISINGIDIESAMQRLGGNMKLFKKLLSEFSSEYDHTVSIIRESLKTDQTETALHWVHTIKGVAGNISAADLYSSSLSLEKAIKEKNADSVKNWMHQFEIAFQDVMTSVKNFLKEDMEKTALNQQHLSDDAFRLSDLADITDHITILSEMLNKNNPRSEQIMELLKTKLQNTPYHTDIQQLDTLISRFNFKESIKLLDRIRQTIEHHGRTAQLSPRRLPHC